MAKAVRTPPKKKADPAKKKALPAKIKATPPPPPPPVPPTPPVADQLPPEETIPGITGANSGKDLTAANDGVGQPGEQPQTIDPPIDPGEQTAIDMVEEFNQTHPAKDAGETVIERPESKVKETIANEEPEEEVPEGFKDRNSMTGIFKKDEREYIDIHLQARIANNLTRDANHFIRQCVNFCVNYQPGWEFGRAKIDRKFFE